MLRRCGKQIFKKTKNSQKIVTRFYSTETSQQKSFEEYSNLENSIFKDKQESFNEKNENFETQENQESKDSKLKREILESALKYVNELGWTTEAISEACAEVRFL